MGELEACSYLSDSALLCHVNFAHTGADVAYLTLRMCGFVRACLGEKLGKSTPETPVIGVDYPVVSTTLGSQDLLVFVFLFIFF